MSVGDILIVVVAGLFCGVINSVAGGGSLVLFPALIAAGLPTLTANVTNSVATWPGYLGGVIGFRDEIRAQRPRVMPLVLATIGGSAAGCVILLVTPGSAFDVVVPVLVLAASLLLAVQPAISRRVRVRDPSPSIVGRPGVVTIVAVVAAMIYGGYFGGALGVIVLGVLALTLPGRLTDLNALKAALSLVDASVSVVVFGLFGPVHWVAVAAAAPSTLVGGYLGARMARHLNDRVLRTAVTIFGIAVAVYLAVR